MVTVIAGKEDCSTPIQNGDTTCSNDDERSPQYIKDYLEVDFHRSASCKPLPNDLVDLTDGQIKRTSIDGSFFVQIDSIESIQRLNNDNNQAEPTNDNSAFLLTLTDGISTVKGITMTYIPDLNCHIKQGCKLLLTGSVLIEDNLLQLTHDNTRFQYGSNTYPRPRSAYRGRGGGSHRPSYEGRRGGAGNSNNRYDNGGGSASNRSKGPPLKTTLMDFMTLLPISNDIRPTTDNAHHKAKDRHEQKRRTSEQNQQSNKTANSINAADSLTTTDANRHSHSNNNHQHYNYADQVASQPEGIQDELEPEDDSSHAGYRERRNPLPPRFQRAQEERTRRNTNRYQDESAALAGGQINGNYHNGTMNSHALASTLYSQHADPMSSYIPYMSSMAQPHAAVLNSYASHRSMLASTMGSVPTPFTFYPPNACPLTYGLASMPNSSFHSQQLPLNPGYVNDALAFCYRTPYPTAAYVSPTVTNGSNDDPKPCDDSSASQANPHAGESEVKPTNESEQHEISHNDDDKSQSQSVEQKAPSSLSPISSSSSNDVNNDSQRAVNEHSEEKCCDSNSNARIRWRVGDVCLARWNEDNQFYPASILHIQAPFCTVIFHEYNNCEKVHFSELKWLPRDQSSYCQFIPPVALSQSDLNGLENNVAFPPSINCAPPTMDECIMMPEAPPFPFNSAGTLYIYPPTVPSISRTSRYNTTSLPSFQTNIRHTENGNVNTTSYVKGDKVISYASASSRDLYNASLIDFAAVSLDDNQQFDHRNVLSSAQELDEYSIANTPIKLTTADNERERSTSTESVTSSRYDEQPSTHEEDKHENGSLVMKDQI